MYGLSKDRERTYIVSGLVAKIESGIELDSLDWELLENPQLRQAVEKMAFERAGDREECVLDWGKLYDIDTFPRFPWEKESRDEERPCNCGSGVHWAICQANSPYCG